MYCDSVLSVVKSLFILIINSSVNDRYVTGFRSIYWNKQISRHFGRGDSELEDVPQTNLSSLQGFEASILKHPRVKRAVGSTRMSLGYGRDIIHKTRNATTQQQVGEISCIPSDQTTECWSRWLLTCVNVTSNCKIRLIVTSALHLD